MKKDRQGWVYKTEVKDVKQKVNESPQSIPLSHKKQGKINKEEKPEIFLRKTERGGLYFFSPKKTVIFFMSIKHVKELLNDERDFVCIKMNKVRNCDNE